MNENDIDILFSYHTVSPNDLEKFQDLINLSKLLAKLILMYGKESKDAERAILKLKECLYFAIVSIGPSPVNR